MFYPSQHACIHLQELECSGLPITGHLCLDALQAGLNHSLLPGSVVRHDHSIAAALCSVCGPQRTQRLHRVLCGCLVKRRAQVALRVLGGVGEERFRNVRNGGYGALYVQHDGQGEGRQAGLLVSC